jgi:tetratricopeptide (TPR) repeat protein
MTFRVSRSALRVARLEHRAQRSKRLPSFPAVVLGLLVLSCLTTPRTASADDLWTTATRAYQQGRYEEAKVNYIQLVQRHHYSPDLFYNLGNTWFKLGDNGRAVLNYYRALALKPTFEEADVNLRGVLKAVDNPIAPTLRLQVATYADYLWIIVAASFWIAAYSALISWITKSKRVWRISALLSGILCLMFLSLAIWAGFGLKDRSAAIVVDAIADLKYGPANTARAIESLHIGDQVSLISERGDWSFCRTNGGTVGWILTRKTEHIVPD